MQKKLDAMINQKPEPKIEPGIIDLNDSNFDQIIASKNPTLVDFQAEWCGPCKLLDKKTFANPDLARYVSEHFYAVKFDAEGNEPIRFYDQNYTNPNYDARKKGRNATHQFTQFLGVKGYPTMVFFSEDGDPIIPVVGYYTAQELEPYLKMIKQGDYMVFLDPDDFDKYLKTYVPRFRGK